MKYAFYTALAVITILLLMVGLPTLVAFLINSHTNLGLLGLIAIVGVISAFFGYRKG